MWTFLKRKNGKRFWVLVGLFFLAYFLHSFFSWECPRGRRDEEKGRRSGLEEEMKGAGNVFIRPKDFEQVEKRVEELNRNVVVREGEKEGACRRPLPHEILFSNTYWQVLRVGGEGEEASSTAFLYNSYLDTRGEKPFVRILLVTDLYYEEGSKATPKFCIFWYPDHTHQTQPVTSIDSVFRWWAVGVKGGYHPFLLSCPLANSSSHIPQSVSLINEDGCGGGVPTNDLKLTYEVPLKREEFGVCFKWVDFPTVDMSKRIVELLELLSILGVAGVHFPLLSATPTTLKVLEYYERIGYAKVKPFSLPGFQPQTPLNSHTYIRVNNETKIRQELVPYLDCFLTNMYKYKYIGVFDLDEVVLPKKHLNYHELFAKLEKRWSRKAPTSFCFHMKLFLNRMLFPNNTIMAQVGGGEGEEEDGRPFFMKKVNYDKEVLCAVNRVRNFKCFHNTDKVLILSNHGPTLCLNRKKSCHQIVPLSQGYTHHHKEQERNCRFYPPQNIRSTNPFGYDNNIERWEKRLLPQTQRVLAQL